MSTLGILAALVAATLILFAVSAPRAHADDTLPVYTSPMDITGGRIQLRAVVPDRDGGQPVEVPLPVGLLGPRMNQVMNTPLGTQMDQFWNGARDPKTGMTPRQQACDGKDGIRDQVRKAVANLGSSYSAYDITCNLATRGEVLAKQVGSTIYLAYLLRYNVVEFRTTSPFTCHPDHGSFLCPNDPKFSVTFASEIWAPVYTPDICHLAAGNGTVTTLQVNIDSHNFSADFAKNIVDFLFVEGRFSNAERAIEAAQRQVPLPLDAALQELRDSEFCRGASLPLARARDAFREFETTVHPRDGIVFRLIHPPLEAPALERSGYVDPSQPTLIRPVLSTAHPIVTAGTAVQVEGNLFPPNSSAVRFDLVHSHYLCLGGATEIEWGPAGGQRRVERLPGDAQGKCAGRYEATNLTPATTYQFRARDCDPFTCSPWSTPVNVTTGATDVGKVALTLDGGTPLGTATVTDKGTFTATVTIPAGTTAGAHTIHAVNGAAKADASVQVTAPTAGGGRATIIASFRGFGETGCPLHPTASMYAMYADKPFPLIGTGFAPGVVTIHLDSATGQTLGMVTAGTDGSFCQDIKGPPNDLAGERTLVAVQNGAVQATTTVRFVSSVIK